MENNKKVNKTALVTGSSKGIGKSIIYNLASRGNNVVINYNQSKELAFEIKEDVEKKFGIKALTIRADVSKFEEIKSMHEEINDIFGGTDILVNCAGIIKDKLFIRYSEEEVLSLFKTNFFSCVYNSQFALHNMIKKKWGRIVSISSIIALVGNKGQVIYSASKAALYGFTISLAKEVYKKGITVNSIAPGFVPTDTSKDAIEYHRKLLPVLNFNIDEYFGKPEDISYLVGCLVDERASYITGETIYADAKIPILR